MKRLNLGMIVLSAILFLFGTSVYAGGFQHNIVLNLDGMDYYLDGPPDGPSGEKDIPGHYWKQAGPNQLVGKHYNSGPFGAASWWATGEEDGALLYIVHGIIDTWSEEKSMGYAASGYIHYHEFVTVDDGTPHPSKVVWLKHLSVGSYYLDGGPHPELAHDVTPGLDWEFVPNWTMPYPSSGTSSQGLAGLASVEVPAEFSFEGAYPNPFNPVTELSFTLPESGNVELSVYSLNGARVAELVSGYRSTGAHSVSFDASNLASGIYFAQLNFSGNTAFMKLVLTK
jgi:selenium-binding protein 1